jgi:hypothetical protein
MGFQGGLGSGVGWVGGGVPLLGHSVSIPQGFRGVGEGSPV